MKLSIDDILKLTGGKLLQTTPEISISGVATLSEACPSEATFLGNEKYYQDYLQTQAGLVLVPPSLPDYPKGPIYVEVENPSLAFNALVSHFMKSTQSFTAGISPHAIIEEGVTLNADKVRIAAGCIIERGASIGDGCDIGPGCIIGQGVRIGENCKFYARVTVRERCEIGHHVVIQPGAVIGSDGFGFLLNKETGSYDTIDQVGIVVIGDHVDIGANTTIDRARFGRTVIGEGCKLDNLVQIGHNVTIGKHSVIVAQTGIAGSTRIGNYVTIAAQCGIAGHLTIGDRVILGAKSGVLSHLEAGKNYWGLPADSFLNMKRQIVCIRQLPAALKEMKKIQAEIESFKASFLS